MTKKESGTDEITPWELTGLPVAPAGAPTENPELQKIIRKNYREPIAEDDTVCAEIDGHTHRVCDIGSRGLGLIVPAPSPFLAGTAYSIMLHIDNNTVALRGKVTHISPGETAAECHCGIEFIELNPEDEKILQQFLTAHHARLFGSTSRSADLGRD